MASTQQQRNARTAVAMLEQYNDRDYAGIADRYAPDGVFTDTAAGSSFKGHKEIEGLFQTWGEAFSDSRLTGITAADAGDVVTVRFTFNGTQDHDFGDMPPTHQRASIPACMVFEFDSKGKIVEDTVYYDALSMMTQLGHIEAPK